MNKIRIIFINPLDIFFELWHNKIIRKPLLKGECLMGMTDKQFNGFVRLMLPDILAAVEKMPDGPEKERLKLLADNLQKMIED